MPAPMTLYDPTFNIVTCRFPERYREAITTLTLLGGFASTLAFPAVGAFALAQPPRASSVQ